MERTRIENWSGPTGYVSLHRSKVAHAVQGVRNGYVILYCGGPHPREDSVTWIEDENAEVCENCARVLDASERRAEAA
jgi:hypothetical protein